MNLLGAFFIVATMAGLLICNNVSAAEPSPETAAKDAADRAEPFTEDWGSLDRYNSVKMGPKQNLLLKMKDATERHGLRWGVTTHLARNYNFFQPGYGADSEGDKKGIPYIKDTPESRSFYHEPHGDLNAKYPVDPSEAWKKSWSSRVTDLIDRYDPDILYFDGAIPFDIDNGLTGRRVLARYYNRGRERHDGKDEVVMTIKTARNGHGIYRDGVATLDLERHKLDQLRETPWQTDDTICVRYWSYVDDLAYQTVDYLIDKLVDIVSKNGNLLLSLPPKPDGAFDDEVARILKEIGIWNRQNGEAIFETRPWTKFGEGDVRFTQSKDGKTLYAIFLTWPEGGQISLTSLPKEGSSVRAVTMLGSEKPVTHRQDDKGLHLTLPKQTNDYAVVVKLSL